MADLGETFDAEQVEPNKAFDPVPNGKYIAILEESPWKEAQSGGRYISLRWKIVDGPFNGRVLFDNLNLINANTTAVEIARGTLSAISRATGVMQVSRTEMLHGIPVTIVVKVKKRKDTGDMDSRIVGYEPAKAVTSPPANTAPAAAGGRPAWMGAST